MKNKLTQFLLTVTLSWVLILFAFIIAGGTLNPFVWAETTRGFCCSIMLMSATGCAILIQQSDDDYKKY